MHTVIISYPMLKILRKLKGPHHPAYVVHFLIPDNKGNMKLADEDCHR